MNYGSLWTLWLSAVPYGLWSEQITRPSMEEYVQWIDAAGGKSAQALEHFGAPPRRHDPSTTSPARSPT